jgi:O-antigen/teichoic acid export membrane protein
MIHKYAHFIKTGLARLSFKNFVPYVGAVYLAQGIVAIRSFINARFLGPEDYGFWGWLTFIVTFGFHLHFGVQEIMVKEIPALQARGQYDEARRISQLVFSFFACMLLIAAMMMVIAAIFLPSSISHVHRLGWMVAAIAMVFEVLFYNEQVVTRSMGFISKMGPAILITSGISLFLTFWLVIQYGIIGIYWVAVFTPLFGFLFLHRYTQYSLKLVWSGQEIKRMIKLGWPIVAMGLSFLALNWVDRSVIMRYFGNTAHGYYTLGATLAFFVFLFPKGLADILEPKLHFHHSQEAPERSILRHFLVPLRIFAWLLPPVLLVGSLLLPWVLKTFLPNYLPGIMVIRVLLWSSYLVGLITLTKSSLVALGRQNQTIPAYLVAIGVNYAVSLLMVNRGLGFSGVPFGSAVAFAVISIWLLVLVLRKLKRSGKEIRDCFVEVYVPFLLLSASSLTYLWFMEDQNRTLPVWFYGASLCMCVIYLWRGYQILVRHVFNQEFMKGPNVVSGSVEVIR